MENKRRNVGLKICSIILKEENKGMNGNVEIILLIHHKQSQAKITIFFLMMEDKRRNVGLNILVEQNKMMNANM